ncbi:uncharacterized protein LOC119268342 isoform X2 [Triticum dicoccoides]|uniref:uncharacterized protein LOC119268342 isoform X2 n=1 Tax=Triticum dicoccoides TaxID=85692 RepID=UPI00188F2703|nr:uncharacterized protein LOC119268342 isoform X2 [Triticum dicoccoides]XP_044340485.1 uncharacterized protein LOC123061440 isoform X3 [Triticum aestivum]
MGKTKTCSSSSSCSSSWWADDGGPALLAPPAPPLPLLLLLPARPQRKDWRRNGVLQRNGCCFFWCRFACEDLHPALIIVLSPAA